MDPNICAQAIAAALDQGRYDEADLSAQALLDWLSRGGFPPRRELTLLIQEIASDSMEDLSEYDSLFAITK